LTPLRRAVREGELALLLFEQDERAVVVHAGERR
jgi:hypothetical protein